ncbi:MAG: hypothetical protein HY670_10640 [Chloroflexi bacterium]|nr:hypothetical protein [Chloroflexota bacterium]
MLTGSVPGAFFVVALPAMMELTQHAIGVWRLETMLDEYYGARGWDVATGLQRREKIGELELDWIIPELEREDAIR